MPEKRSISKLPVLVYFYAVGKILHLKPMIRKSCVRTNTTAPRAAKVYLLTPSDFRVSFHVSVGDSHRVLQLLRHQWVTQRCRWSLQRRIAEMYLFGGMGKNPQSPSYRRTSGWPNDRDRPSVSQSSASHGCRQELGRSRWALRITLRAQLDVIKLFFSNL